MKKKFTMFIVGTVLTCTTFAGSIFAESISKSSEMQAITQAKVIKGIQMVPLREVSEKLGFSVIWDTKENTIYLDDGIMNTTLTVGVDNYYASSSTAIGMSAPQTFGAGPLLIDGKVYVPAEMFCALLGNTENAVVISNGAATFTKSVENNTKNKNYEGEQIPNPYTEHDSIEGLKDAVSFQFSIPSKLPTGYDLSNMYDISNKVIDMRWRKGDAQIIYRVAQGEGEDISGDYNAYDQITSTDIGGIPILLKGTDDKIYVATWTNGDYTFSISVDSFGEGLEYHMITDMISSIQ